MKNHNSNICKDYETIKEIIDRIVINRKIKKHTISVFHKDNILISLHTNSYVHLIIKEKRKLEMSSIYIEKNELEWTLIQKYKNIDDLYYIICNYLNYVSEYDLDLELIGS